MIASIAVLMLIAGIALIVTPAHSADAEWLVTYSHNSDLLRGKPFNNQPEPWQDFLGTGVTISWPKVELDLIHGVKRIKTPETGKRPSESGSQLNVRWYPLRKVSR